MSCANTNVTAQWITTEVNRGYRLLFIWVGPQAPCTGYADRIPYNTSDAFDKGRAVAQNAFQHASADLDLTIADLPIVYDLENFDTTNASCLDAAKAFMRGWTSYLHQGVSQTSGLYGSVAGSGLDEFWSISPNPDFIWGAKWDGNSHTSQLSPVAAAHWTNRRHKQFIGETSRTANGVTLQVDVNCAGGPMYGNSDTVAISDCS